jgi:hypothetical protein
MTDETIKEIAKVIVGLFIGGCGLAYRIVLLLAAWKYLHS